MPEQSKQLAESRNFLNAFQHELDRFEQFEKSLQADDRKEREQRLSARFAAAGVDLAFPK